MIQTTDRSAGAAWGELVLTPDEQTADYVRRIHWWVRLFGIIWIVVPIVLTVLAIFFLIGAAANSSTGGY